MPKEEFLKHVTSEDQRENLKASLDIKNSHRETRVEKVKDVQKAVKKVKKKKVRISYPVPDLIAEI